MKMRSSVFTDDNYRQLVDRMEGELELLSVEYNIVGVSITAQAGSVSYAGVIFYSLKAK